MLVNQIMRCFASSFARLTTSRTGSGPLFLTFPKIPSADIHLLLSSATTSFPHHRHLTFILPRFCSSSITKLESGIKKSNISMAGEHHMPRRKLGSQGLEVSALGLGCRSLTSSFENPPAEEDAIAVIHHAYHNGVTFFDTSDFYGPHTNEVFMGKALKDLPRENVQLATKFGNLRVDGKYHIRGDAAYVRKSCEDSLERLGLDYIDLFYQHRVDSTVPIEITVGAMKELVEEGKVKYIGLSEASPEIIRRAHAVHPITALQMEWSLWSRDIEDEIVPLCRELGIGIVPYSPLGRGFFSGKPVHEGDYRPAWYPRFESENLEKNKVLFERVALLAKKCGCTPGQLALAWLMHQGDNVVPIPGTSKIRNLDENIGGAFVELTPEEIEEVAAAVPQQEVAGSQSHQHFDKNKWNVVTTPPLESYVAPK